MNELISFLKDFSTHDVPIVCFTGKTYPVIFLKYLINKTLGDQRYTYHAIDITITDIATIQSLLSMSFLGNNFLIWYSQSSEVDTKKLKEAVRLLQGYKGPHKVWFFAPEIVLPSQREGWTCIPLPSELTQMQTKSLITALNDLHWQKLYEIMDGLFALKSTYSLDELTLLHEYSKVLNRALWPDFSKQWLPHLMVPEKSLFILSTHLFSKNQKDFFTLWYTLNQDFTPQFWISFWSDQLLRASAFIRYSRQKKWDMAKKISYKLPFSFIKKDWQLHTVEFLVESHKQLYDLDYHLKNGGSAIMLDTWYYSWFA